jgi:hypothetical protein
MSVFQKTLAQTLKPSKGFEGRIPSSSKMAALCTVARISNFGFAWAVRHFISHLGGKIPVAETASQEHKQYSLKSQPVP